MPLRVFILLVIFDLSLFFSLAQNKNNHFMKQFHMPGVDVPSGIVELEDGWIISALSSSKFPDFSPVSTCFMKIDLAGNIVWKKFYGDTITAYYILMDQTVIQDNNSLFQSKDGNIIALGSSGLNYYAPPMVVKINPSNGDTLWTYMEAFDDYFYAIDAVEDNVGNIYFLVMRNYFNQPGYPCVYKLNKSGKLVWKNHLKKFHETMPTKIFINNGSPVFCVNLYNVISFRDSVVLQKLDSASGQLQDKVILEPKNWGSGIPSSDVIQLYAIDNEYNLLLSSSSKEGYKTQLYLDSGLNIKKKIFISNVDTNTYINSLYKKGYTHSTSYELISFTNPENKIELQAKTCNRDLGDSIISFVFQSKHGGAIQLGWVFSEGINQWRDCNGKIDCKDILFVKSDSLGRYFPNNPSIKDKVVCYPNPTKNTLTLKFELGIASKVNIQFFDGIGRIVLDTQSELLEKGFHEKTIDVMSLSKGIYFVKFSSEGYSNTYKIIIE